MITMDQIHLIRALYYEQGKNISEIAQELNLNWRTVQKYVDMTDFNLPVPKPESASNICPKLEPYKPTIDKWLQEDKKAPRKQRHTARRVHERLTKEVEGYGCSYRLVAEYMSLKKHELHLDNKDKGKLPLIHYPGEAQVDFGSADFYENGKHYSGKYLVLSFPYSNHSYFQLNYGENMECLLEALVTIFNYIGGVPTEIWFDNTSTIVTGIIKGGGRDVTERFARFREHYGFKALFCNPESGWEKGNVESKVGYDRRNFLVPVPRFISLVDFNQAQLAKCDEDSDRDHYRKDASICELFTADTAALLPLPKIAFDTSGHIYGVRTDGWGKFTLNSGKHTYSVSPRHANSTVNINLTSSTVTVSDGDFHEIVTHKRLYGNECQESMDWVPYLSYVSKHPRSLMNTGIYAMMPENMRTYISSCSNQDKGKILKILSELTGRTGFDSAVRTVDQAIVYQATDPDSLKNLYRSLYSDVPELPPVDTGMMSLHLTQMPADLASYDKLLEKGGAVNE